MSAIFGHFSTIFLRHKMRQGSSIPSGSLRDPPIKEETNRRGDVITTYTNLFPKYARPVLSHELAFNNEMTVADKVRDLLSSIFIPKDARVRVMIGKGGFGLEGIPTFDFQVDEAISTTFVDKGDLVAELEDTIQTVMMRYDGNASHLIVNDVTLTVLVPNPNNGAGDLILTGGIYTYLAINTSDDRVKHNEEDISGSLAVIRKLRPQVYDKTATMGDDQDLSGAIREAGFIAQEVAEIPELLPYVDVGRTRREGRRN